MKLMHMQVKHSGDRDRGSEMHCINDPKMTISMEVDTTICKKVERAIMTASDLHHTILSHSLLTMLHNQMFINWHLCFLDTMAVINEEPMIVWNMQAYRVSIAACRMSFTWF